MNMATIADMLTRMKNGDVKIRNAIVTKGVAVPDSTLFEALGDKILAIPQEGGTTTPTFGASWGRSPERPALPFDEDTGPEENSMYMLIGVTENALNSMVVYFSGAISAGTIDWGDGNEETFSATTGVSILRHDYNFDTVSVLPDTDNIKWLWLKVSFTGTLPTTFSTGAKPLNFPSSGYYVIPVYEWYINMPSLTDMQSSSTTPYQRYHLLEYFRWYGNCNVTYLSNFGAYTLRLKECIFDNMAGVKSLTSFLYYSGISGKVEINIGPTTLISQFMRNCASFNYPVNVDTSKTTSIQYFFQSSTSMAFGLDLDLNAHTVDIGTSTFTGMYALPWLRLRNMPSVVSTIWVSLTAMTASALADLFGDLYDRSSLTAGTITITNAAGAASLTTEQRAIATNKNWTIVG